MENLESLINPEASQLLARLGRFLGQEGVRSYLVGGFVRDMLLRRQTADIDIAVADALNVAARVAGAFGGKYVPLDEVNGIARVALNGSGAGTKDRWLIDFSTLRGSIEQDLAERDFTIDAMAIELNETTSESTLSAPALIDPFRGQDDLKRRLIRAVSTRVFEADAARLLRAVRLAAELDFAIDRDTEALIRQHCRLISGIAGERIREELLKILSLPGASKHLARLDELGLLTVIIPEMAQARGVSQPPVHFWDVFNHSIQTVATLDFLLRRGSVGYAGDEVLAMVPWSAELSDYFDQEINSGSTRSSLLKLAAFLHDIAKPQTKTVDEDGRARFWGHPDEGATVVAGILERLRFSARETCLVQLMVKHHLRPGQMSHNELPSHRAVYRYFRDTGDTGVGILFLSLADHLATRGPTLDLAEWRWHTRIVEYVLSQYFAGRSVVAPVKLIDGHDLIKVFGLTPGPKIGKLLEAVREAQAAGEVTTREESLAYVDRLLRASESNEKQV